MLGNLRGHIEDKMLLHAADWLPTIIEGFIGVNNCVQSPDDIDGKNMLDTLTGNRVWDRNTLYLQFSGNYTMECESIQAQTHTLQMLCKELAS